MAYFRTLGITEVYLYQADTAGPAADWARGVAANPDVRFFAESGNLGSMLVGPFADYARDRRLRRHLHLRRHPLRGSGDGHRPVPPPASAACSAPRRWRRASTAAGPAWSSCPSSRPPTGSATTACGAAALAAGADVVSITSWNEWHEGTQIEPAKPWCFPIDNFCSPGYEGAYGRSGPAARTAYMDRTAEWATTFRQRHG